MELFNTLFEGAGAFFEGDNWKMILMWIIGGMLIYLAIKKQMDLIDKIHSLGGEVLMSSHVYKFRTPERVLEIALSQQERGADIVKIVTGADSREEELKNLEICHLLKQELKVPFLFLSCGEYNQLHRNIGPALGVCMWLCFSRYDETTYVGPPLLENVIKIKDALKL